MDSWTVDKTKLKMSQHFYSLQKYAGISSRYACPSCGKKHCFSLYVDEDGNPIDESVGRCDHESSCGYHVKPSDWFRDHPETTGKDWRNDRPAWLDKSLNAKRKKPVCSIPFEFVNRSVRLDIECNLTRYLNRIIDPLVVESVRDAYKVGVTKALDTIYFQIDAQGRCRSGKIMKYNPETGHRIKDEETPGKVSWIHSLLKARHMLPDDWELTQCLFGEHLLPQYPNHKVALVESEKTALICAALMPQYVWLATGGKTQLGEKLNALKGRDVIAFPDVDAYDTWKEKLSLSVDFHVTVSDYLEKTATPEERAAKIDIADRLLSETRAASKSDTHQQNLGILKYFSPEHRDEVKALIEELDLIPISITRLEQRPD